MQISNPADLLLNYQMEIEQPTQNMEKSSESLQNIATSFLEMQDDIPPPRNPPVLEHMPEPPILENIPPPVEVTQMPPPIEPISHLNASPKESENGVLPEFGLESTSATKADENTSEIVVSKPANDIKVEEQTLIPPSLDTFVVPPSIQVNNGNDFVEPKLPASLVNSNIPPIPNKDSIWTTFRQPEQGFLELMPPPITKREDDSNSEFSSSNEYKPPESEVEEESDGTSSDAMVEEEDSPDPSPKPSPPRKRRNPWSADEDFEQRKIRKIEEAFSNPYQPTSVVTLQAQPNIRTTQTPTHTIYPDTTPEFKIHPPITHGDFKNLLPPMTNGDFNAFLPQIDEYYQKPQLFEYRLHNKNGGKFLMNNHRGKSNGELPFEYHGVTTDGHWWIALRRINEKNICGGFYKTRREAAEKSDVLWQLHNGDPAYINFPDMIHENVVISITEVPAFAKNDDQEKSPDPPKYYNKKSCRLCGVQKFKLKWAVLPGGNEASICRKCEKTLKRNSGEFVEEIPLEKTEREITPGEGKRNRRKIYCAHCEKTFFAKPTRRDAKFILNHCCSNPNREVDPRFPTEKRKQYVLGKHHRKCRIHDESEPCLAFVDEWFYHGTQRVKS